MRMTIKLHGSPMRVVHRDVEDPDPAALDEAADAAVKALTRTQRTKMTATRLGDDARETAKRDDEG